MLTSETKQKINNCRDYLVGKIPDPKGQIDQITNALIYKFMSDQDKLAIEIGGNATFFVDQGIKGEKGFEEYEKYSWDNLFKSTLTNDQKAKLYIAGIEQLSKAEHLPELFIDIFKDAFLPFRDSNTIVLFLTEINKFEYNHSEELGNAFEYLLSIMGSQGNAGQFRTPRHIIDFLVDVVDPQPSETIYDPACGTAGFLISAYKHIVENNPNLSVVEQLNLAKNISGVDIDPGMAKIARVNLYLHGFKNPSISEDDTLSNVKLWDNKYDVILANPPFMTPKGGIKVHEGYYIKSTKAEVLFTDYIAEHLKLNGRAGIIVPEGIIFQSANAYKDLRKMLIEDKLLYAVVSLPSGIFNPYSGVKTSILFFDRDLAKKSDNILFLKVENDGYDLGAQRREISKNDLPKTLEILNNYKKSIQEKTEFSKQDKNVLLVEKSKISENGEYNLSAERYREIILTNSDYDMVELGEVCEINSGNSAPQDKKLFENGKYPFYRTSDVGKAHLSHNLLIVQDWLNNDGIKGLKLFKKGTILFPKSGASTFLNHRAIMGQDGYISSHLAAIFPKDKIISEFLYNLLVYIDAKDICPNQAYPSLKISDISKIKIPLPPLDIQEEIVKELDSYQKIIDGAKMVVENYKPQIKIESDWDMVELGEVCDNLDNQRKPVSAGKREKGIYPYYGASGIVDYVKNYIFDGEYLLVSEDGANLLARTYPIAFSITGKNWVNNHAHILEFKNKFTRIFVELYLNSINLYNYITGAAQPKLNQKNLKEIKIPLPSIEIQKEIVERIEREQELVECNRKLIEIFEKKIEEKIGEVWGEKV